MHVVLLRDIKCQSWILDAVRLTLKIRKDCDWIYRADDVCSWIINAEIHCCFLLLYIVVQLHTSSCTLTERSTSSNIYMDKPWQTLRVYSSKTMHQMYLTFSVNVPVMVLWSKPLTIFSLHRHFNDGLLFFLKKKLHSIYSTLHTIFDDTQTLKELDFWFRCLFCDLTLVLAQTHSINYIPDAPMYAFQCVHGKNPKRLIRKMCLRIIPIRKESKMPQNSDFLNTLNPPRCWLEPSTSWRNLFLYLFVWPTPVIWGTLLKLMFPFAFFLCFLDLKRSSTGTKKLVVRLLPWCLISPSSL